MGWGSGARVADDLWEKIAPLIDGMLYSKRRAFAVAIKEVLESNDCDTLQESVLYEKFPDLFERD